MSQEEKYNEHESEYKAGHGVDEGGGGGGEQIKKV